MPVQPAQIVKNLVPTEPVTINKIQPLGKMVSPKFTGVNTNRANSKVISIEDFEQLEDAHDGMDFLHSHNRFNVAVSRARAVFIPVANSALLEAECKSPAQIKLAHALCRYWEVA